jgi:hypothetical protein
MYNFISVQYDYFMVGHEKVPDNTTSDIAAFSEAKKLLKTRLSATEEDLKHFHEGRLDLIKIDDSKNGNTYQDLLLTWLGYKFGQNMANNKFATKEEAARWLTMMLTDTDLTKVAKTDPFYEDAQQLQKMLEQFRQIQQKLHPAPKK